MEFQYQSTIIISKPYKMTCTNHVQTTITKGKSKWVLTDYGRGDINVFKTVNGKKSTIASPIGKYFHTWNDLFENYPSLHNFLYNNVMEKHNLKVNQVKKMRKMNEAP